MIFTTRTLSTLKFLGFAGMMESAASATSEASLSSEPYCFEAMAGLRADSRVSCVRGDGRLNVESSAEQTLN
jgi:hypothetical protein